MGGTRPKVMPSDAGRRASEVIAQVKRAHEYDMARPSIMKFRGTLLPLVLGRWELWFFMGVHTLLVVLYRLRNDLEYGSGIPAIPLLDVTEMPWATVMIPTGLLTFFLVFFNGKCYERFIGYYNAHTAISGHIQEIACQTLAAWPSADFSGHRWEACRYLMASGIVVYMKVSDPPGKPQPIDDDEWDRLTQSEGAWLHEKEPICAPLLTHDEVEVLKQHRGNLQLLLQTWALRALRHGCIECMPPAESQLTYLEMERKVFALRKACGFIVNNLAMPIPFPYFHALNLLLVINYSLYTYSFLFFETVLSPVVLFLVILVTLGMREVSTALSNPFGEDEVDFPMHKYIKSLRGLISGLVTSPLLPPIVPGKQAPASLRNRLQSPGGPAATAGRAPFEPEGAPLSRDARAATVERLPVAPPPPGPAPPPLHPAPPPSTPHGVHHAPTPAAGPALLTHDAQLHAQAHQLAQQYLLQYLQQAAFEPHAAAAAAAAAAGAAGGGRQPAGMGSPLPPPRGAALPPIGPRYVTPAVAQQLQVGAQGGRPGELYADLGPPSALSAGFTPAPAYEHVYSADGLPMAERPLGGR